MLVIKGLQRARHCGKCFTYVISISMPHFTTEASFPRSHEKDAQKEARQVDASSKATRPPEAHAVMINMHPEELPLLCDVPTSADIYLLHSPSAGIPASRQEDSPVLLTIRSERCGVQSSLTSSYVPY